MKQISSISIFQKENIKKMKKKGIFLKDYIVRKKKKIDIKMNIYKKN